MGIRGRLICVPSVSGISHLVGLVLDNDKGRIRRGSGHLLASLGPFTDSSWYSRQLMNPMKLVIALHSLYWSIHTKDESKRGTAFAFIFGVN